MSTEHCHECQRDLTQHGHRRNCSKSAFNKRTCYHTRVSRLGNCLAPGCGEKNLTTTFGGSDGETTT